MPVTSFICNAERFLERVTVHLSFNFKNDDDFSILGSILKKKEQNDDYIIFDEWGRILGVSETNFNRIIIKNALQEFGVVS